MNGSRVNTSGSGAVVVVGAGCVVVVVEVTSVDGVVGAELDPPPLEHAASPATATSTAPTITPLLIRPRLFIAQVRRPTGRSPTPWQEVGT
jgi:hypothetical protein